jgi:hypothetical protein
LAGISEFVSEDDHQNSFSPNVLPSFVDMLLFYPGLEISVIRVSFLDFIISPFLFIPSQYERTYFIFVHAVLKIQNDFRHFQSIADDTHSRHALPIQVKRMDRTTGLLRKVSKLKFNAKGLMGQARMTCTSLELEDIRMGAKSWQEIKREKLWEGENGGVHSTDLCEVKMII